MIGKDLRSRTCLTTAGDNGVFEFFWTQGENGKKKNKNQVGMRESRNFSQGPQGVLTFFLIHQMYFTEGRPDLSGESN